MKIQHRSATTVLLVLLFTAVLFVVGGQAWAKGNGSPPEHASAAGSETEVDEETEELSEESSTEATEEAVELEDETVELQVFRLRSADDAKSGDSSGDATQRSSSDAGDRSDPTSSSDFVETAEDCPNEANQYGEFTGNGANDSGFYNSTCDGRASENGNGAGEATGKPCMGCVGNADNKNPGINNGKGQMPNGGDANSGYECEEDGDPDADDDGFKGNNGVGKGNPAHTDCQEQPAVTQPPVKRPPVKRPPLPDVIKRPVLPPDRVKPRVPFARPPEVPRFVPKRRVQSVLPVTGPKELLPYVWIALMLIAAGLTSLLTARRRQQLRSLQH